MAKIIKTETLLDESQLLVTYDNGVEEIFDAVEANGTIFHCSTCFFLKVAICGITSWLLSKIKFV